MWCHAMSDVVWNVVMRCGMMWCMGNMLVCCDARCEMWLWNTECCGMVWCHIRHGVTWNDGRNAVWDVCCGIVCCVIYIWMWWCAWHGMKWNVGTMWNGVPRCGGVIWCELWCDVKCGVMCIRNVVPCGMSVAIIVMWNVDWNAKCGIWCGVEYGVLVCGMLHNESCGKLQCDVKYGVELWWRIMWHMQCDRCEMSDVENDATCCNVRCGGVM